MNSTTCTKRPKSTTQSSQPTGAGVHSALVCAGCGAQLQATEVYACGSCLDLWIQQGSTGQIGVDDD
ncbi:protein NinF [Duffyella gerundensis]|uniref:protein NinF n=1 Tax=Duffyella gerundensis TaxID=1619313 RepID=UPI003D1629C1